MRCSGKRAVDDLTNVIGELAATCPAVIVAVKPQFNRDRDKPFASYFRTGWDSAEFDNPRLVSEVALEPGRSQTRHFLQGSRLLKQMGRAFNDRQMFLSLEFFISPPIEFDDHVIQSADD